MLTDDGRTTDAEVTGILLAHLRAFGSGELIKRNLQSNKNIVVGHAWIQKVLSEKVQL